MTDPAPIRLALVDDDPMVRAVASGQPMLSSSVTAQLIAAVAQLLPVGSDRSGTARSAMSTLTDREREVAVAVGRGLSNAEISGELFMSVPTVRTHVGRLFTKLDVDNRVQLAILVHDVDR